MKVSKLQEKVIRALSCDEANPDCAYYIQWVADRADVSHREARLALRALKRKGLCEHVQLMDENDGMCRGSGYQLTAAGYLQVPVAS